MGYGPHDWKEVSKHSSESAQSPIKNKAQNDPGLKGLRFTCDNNKRKVSGTLTNNGHAPTLSIDKPKGTGSLTGGPLGKSVYGLEQIHFHFGCKHEEGSEHTVDGKAFSGEVRMRWSKIAQEHMEYCIVQRCKVQCKSKRFGSAAFITSKSKK